MIMYKPPIDNFILCIAMTSSAITKIRSIEIKRRLNTEMLQRVKTAKIGNRHNKLLYGDDSVYI